MMTVYFYLFAFQQVEMRSVLTGFSRKQSLKQEVPVHYLLLYSGAEVRDKSREAEREGEPVQGCFWAGHC